MAKVKEPKFSFAFLICDQIVERILTLQLVSMKCVVKSTKIAKSA